MLNILNQRAVRLARDQRGVSLLEVIISTVVLGLAITGFLMALSTASTTSRIGLDQSKLVYFANLEIESLQGAKFEEVPFLQTSVIGSIQEVPNYFRDLAISERLDLGGEVTVVASGDLAMPLSTYGRDLAFDGKRAEYYARWMDDEGREYVARWMGDENALSFTEVIIDPIAGGPGGGGPVGGGPNEGPSGGGGVRPDEYNYIYCAFPELTRISRILYDNRFNISEYMGASLGDFDYLPHIDDVWQRSFEFFYSGDVLYGVDWDPWQGSPLFLESFSDLGYGSSGIYVIFDDPADPLEAGVIGVHNMDVYSDFDINFHWPYASEIEVYGFDHATFYQDVFDPNLVYGDADTELPLQYNNVIMYFPNYGGSRFDLGRRVYTEAESEADAITSRPDLLRVEIKFFPATQANRLEAWQQMHWWQRDESALASFNTVFYRDEPTRVDRLPNVRDFPSHMVYGNDEELSFSYHVPGASEIRVHFGTFDLEWPSGGLWDDAITVRDGDDNIYITVDGTGIPVPAWSDWPWTPWIAGDTVVIDFISDGAGNSYDMGYNGWAVDQIEVRWVGLQSENP